jgi:hypothetical protein
LEPEGSAPLLPPLLSIDVGDCDKIGPLMESSICVTIHTFIKRGASLGVAARTPPNTIDAVRAAFKDMSPVGIDLCDADTVDVMNFKVLLSPKAAFTFFLRAACASVVPSNGSIASLLSAEMLRTTKVSQSLPALVKINSRGRVTLLP